MLRNVDTKDEENRSDSHVHTNIRQIWRTIDTGAIASTRPKNRCGANILCFLYASATY